MLDKLLNRVIEEFGHRVAFAGLAFTHDNGTVLVDLHEEGYYVAALDLDGEFIDDYIAFDEAELSDVIWSYIDR